MIDAHVFTVLQRIKYKPNWSFNVLNPSSDLVVLQIRIMDGSHEIGREINFRPSGYHDAMHLLANVLRHFEDIEVGLCRAWFKEANK